MNSAAVNPKTILILGAGPAGLGAAWRLGQRGSFNVQVVEQRGSVGGNAGTFTCASIPVDYGSHRLHPACDPVILDDLRSLLGSDLLKRPRHGRIRLRNRWIHFPLRAFDLMTHLPPTFALGVFRDAAAKLLPTDRRAAATSFSSVLQDGLGRTICRDFYFPYATKIWGMSPDDLSPIQARRRVSASSLGRMVKKLFRRGHTSSSDGRSFYYPRNGYGQISEALADAARTAKATIQLSTTVRRIYLGPPHHVDVEAGNGNESIRADHLWSTIPLAVLPRLVYPAPSESVLAASGAMTSRAMVLVYLVLPVSQFTPFDAHYFPNGDVSLTRLSEPVNYSGLIHKSDHTVICAELPCTTGDSIWNASADDLETLVRGDLTRCDLAMPSKTSAVEVTRLSHAYPIYRRGYEDDFSVLDRWSAGLDSVLTFGRQGLFAHDNTHHALAMAYAAAECLMDDGSFDHDRWRRHRAIFESHVVED